MPERIETSILASLSELKEIEKQRIADEKAAVERTRQAELEAKRAAEQAKVDTEEARIRAEREEIMKIQLAQVEYERQHRLRVEAAEAAERARLQAALDEQRLHAELELRREEVARKRPTWMLAVTAIAAIAAVCLTWFAIDSSRQTARAEAAARAADVQKQQARERADEAQAGLAKLKADMSELDGRIAAAELVLKGKLDEAEAKRVQDQLVKDKKARDQAAHEAWLIEQANIKADRNHIIDVTKCTGASAGSIDCVNGVPTAKKLKK
jgi:colicin import membrane protein